MGGSNKEGNAQFFFQVLDVLAHSRLGKIQGSRGFADGSGLGNDLKNVKAVVDHKRYRRA